MKTLIQHIAESKALHQNVNIDEKLKINKDFKGVNLLDDLIDEQINFKEGIKINKKCAEMSVSYIKSNVEYSIKCCNARISHSELAKVVSALDKVLNFNDCYCFDYGYKKPNNSLPPADSVKKFVVDNTRSFPNKNVLFEYEGSREADNYWIFYLEGNKYTFALLGSDLFVRVYISKK